MDEKLLLKAVVLAGEIMLSSGAEVSRVENTMQFMLRRSNCEVTEAVVLATGLFVTMADPGGEPMTFSKRIPARSTTKSTAAQHYSYHTVPALFQLKILLLPERLLRK